MRSNRTGEISNLRPTSKNKKNRKNGKRQQRRRQQQQQQQKILIFIPLVYIKTLLDSTLEGDRYDQPCCTARPKRRRDGGVARPGARKAKIEPERESEHDFEALVNFSSFGLRRTHCIDMYIKTLLDSTLEGSSRGKSMVVIDIVGVRFLGGWVPPRKYTDNIIFTTFYNNKPYLILPG